MYVTEQFTKQIMFVGSGRILFRWLVEGGYNVRKVLLS
jgi:hypothetical protein